MRYRDFTGAIDATVDRLRYNGSEVDTGHWQGVPTEGKPDLVTVEVPNVNWSVPMPLNEYAQDDGLEVLRKEIQPNLPWADDHFAERVSRVPSNPGEEYKNWPWWRGQETYTAADLIQEAHDTGFKFTHTYQERYWPRRAGDYPLGHPLHEFERPAVEHRGIRYRYGDLDDLVALLLRQPYTRQAWLPIFFPEDTGAVHGGRIPCTLGYQFMLRENKLHMWYIIRSCDIVRHFRDDLYLSARLLLWVLEECRRRSNEALEFLTEGTGFERPHSKTLWDDVTPGIFYFNCFSLHYHRGDEHLVR